MKFALRSVFRDYSQYLPGNGAFFDNRYRVVMATKVVICNFPSVYEFVTLPIKSLYGTEVMPDISVTAS